MEEKAAKKIMKLVKFPGGDKLIIKGYSFSDGISLARWSKSGGHAGAKILSKMLGAAVDAGFQVQDHDSSMTPDGSRSDSGTTLIHPETGVKINYTKHYGGVAYENHFTATITFPD
jgi:hypothetical protein